MIVSLKDINWEERSKTNTVCREKWLHITVILYVTLLPGIQYKLCNMSQSLSNTLVMVLQMFPIISQIS